MDTFVNKSATHTEPPSPRINQKAAQLRSTRVLFIAHNEHATDTFSIDFSDPELLRFRIMVRCEAGKECGDECLELHVPPEFLGVQSSVLLNRPAHVAYPVRPNRYSPFADRAAFG